jgi:hypothetical protein
MMPDLTLCIARPMVGRRPAYKPQRMEPRPKPRLKVCGDCRRPLPGDQFGRDLYRADGLNRRCKRCNADRAMVYDARERAARASRSTDET